MNNDKTLLKPFPGRLFSIVIAISCLILLWSSVFNHNVPSHGVATLLLVTSGLSSFHAFGWRPKYLWERWLLSPIGSLLLIAITAFLHF